MIEPGKTIGMLGSGQLGRMFAHEAQRMGYRVHVFSPGTDTPAGQAANLEITARYDDYDAVRVFAQQVDVVTLEFENIPTATVDVVSETVEVHPGRNVLEVAQNRITEKSKMRELGLPVPEFAIVHAASDIREFLSKHTSRGAVLKSAEAGYDGKGQVRILSGDDADAALDAIDHQAAIIEEFVSYEFELSVVCARSASGEIRSFGPITNIHQNHILDVSVAPSSQVSPQIRAELIDIAESLMDSLQCIGVLCVEFFLGSDGRILINEIAPRPHNSGHLTIEACTTSQFEQQVRAVCGLPLGSMEQTQSAAMVNLLGQHLPIKPAQLKTLLALPTVKLHLYGKSLPNINRKMGHLTATAETPDIAEKHVREARAILDVANPTSATVDDKKKP